MTFISIVAKMVATEPGEIMQVQALDLPRHVRERADDTLCRFSPAIPRLPGITAGLAYLAPTTERPYNYMYEPPAGTTRQNCEYRVSPVWIKDARAMRDGLRLWMPRDPLPSVGSGNDVSI
jgi:hypothetical protein